MNEAEYYPLMVISTRFHIPNRLTILGNIGNMTAKRANEILAENIRQLMTDHQTLGTQAALARKSGLAQSSIQRVLTAAVHPQLDVIEAIARAFKVTPAELLTPHLSPESTPASHAHPNADALSDEEKEKVASYVRFLLYERARDTGTKGEDDEFIRLADLRELSVDQLAQVMRPTLREPNNNMLTSHESDHSETKRKKSRSNN